MDSKSREYFLIFDTNILFQAYTQKADFTDFSFSSTFSNTLDMVNQLDIYEQVSVVVPEVLWGEMKRQIVDEHAKKEGDYKQYIEKWKFPEYTIVENDHDDYEQYISQRIQNYKESISSGINTVVELPLPSKDCFPHIVNRAFQKKPPFGGKDKNSDKGFKDVLLWESIMEFAASHPTASMIFYSKDNGFKDILVEEFKGTYENADISICSSEQEVRTILQNWAKEIDIYSYNPIPECEEYTDIEKWLESGDFLIQVIERDYGVVEKGRLIISTGMHLIDYDNIECIEDTDSVQKYKLDATLKAEYILKDGASTSEQLKVQIIVECLDDGIFTVKDVFLKNQEPNESEG